MAFGWRIASTGKYASSVGGGWKPRLPVSGRHRAHGTKIQGDNKEHLLTESTI